MKIEDWLSETPMSDLWREHIEEYYPWANYMLPIHFFESKVPGFYTSKTKGIFTWCDENLTGQYDLQRNTYFEFEEDAVLFALRWA